MIVSLSLPQSEPVKALRMLLRVWTLALRSSVCCLKDKRLSKVTPRNFGFLTVGTCSPLISMGNSVLHSLEAVVKRVAEDFDGDMNRFLLLNQVSKVLR